LNWSPLKAFRKKRIHSSTEKKGNKMSRSEGFILLDSEDVLKEALNKSHDEPVVVFKHSNTCPISTRANRQMEKLSKPTDPPVYRLIVQYSRNLSNEIASKFNIKHESPQVIVLKDGEPIFTASHYAVSTESVRNVL